jgi:membrane fusion protein, heavy metal efflux system
MSKWIKRMTWSAAAVALMVVGAFVFHHAVTASAALVGNNPDPPEPFKVEGDVIAVVPDAIKTAGIETVGVTPADVPATLTLSGRTDLDQERVTHVHAQFPGRVVHVGPQLGDRVTGPEGGATPTTLCAIESTDLAQAKSNWLQAKVQLKLDEDNLVRTRELLKSKILAEKYLLDAESAVTKSRAVLDASRQQLLIFGLADKDLDSISLQQGKERMTYALTSPRTGMVVEKGVVGGELADPTLNLFTVADTSRLWVWGDVYERDRQRVKEGQEISVILTSDPEHVRRCKVEWISPVIDAGTRSIKIRGSLENQDGHLLAQMYATLAVTVSDGQGSLVIPADAVVRKASQAYVFVQAGSGPQGMSFRRTKVKVEPLDAGPGLGEAPAGDGAASRGVPAQRLRVIEGLTPGQQIVRNGALGLFNEMEQQQQQNGK